MKNIAFGFASIALLTAAPVMAADMPVKAPLPAAAAAYNWSGCYVGANAGWIGNRDEYTLSPGGTYFVAPGAAAPPNAGGTGDFAADISALTNAYTSRDSGGLVGGQIGCNFQSGQAVGGIEADGQWSSAKTSVSSAYGAFPNVGNPSFTNAPHTEQASTNLDALFTFRGRAGYAWDRLLLYVTAGVAVGEIKTQTNVTFANTGLAGTVYSGATHIGSSSNDRAGFVVGAGAEYAFITNWSLKAEFLYIDLGTLTTNAPLVAAAAPGAVGLGYSWNTQIHERDAVARVGLNYKFH